MSSALKLCKDCGIELTGKEDYCVVCEVDKTPIPHKPRVYGYHFKTNTIMYDCECGDLEHGQKECQYGHKIDWRGKKKYWKNNNET